MVAVGVSRSSGVRGVLALLASSAWAAGCGIPLGEDVESQTSALVSARVSPAALGNVVYQACCSASFVAVPEGIAKWDAINEPYVCNTEDYIGANALSSTQTPYWAGASFNMGISAIPVGAKITSMEAVVCVRLRSKIVKGSFAVKGFHWGQGDNPTNKVTFFVDSNGLENITIPAKGIFGSNPFTLYTLAGSPPYDPNPVPKPANAYLGASVFGNNVDISQIYFTVNYTTF